MESSGETVVKASTFWVGLGITVAVPLASAAAEFDPSTVTDVRVWLVGIVAASVRQAGVYLLSWLSTRKVDSPTGRA